jgi:lysophospholipase L1-like esterase
MVGSLLRLALVVTAVLGVVAGVSELGLRAAGVGPRGAVGLTDVVPDRWTAFRLRPGIPGPEAFATNEFGMHAPRPYTLEPPPVSLRVAVLGSSVVYGMALPFADTIPAATQRELLLAGQPAEVLNFGTQGFTIVHVSAQLQVYVHQFQPDVVVVVLDLQVGLADWPDVRPQVKEERIEKLGFWPALLKRGSEKSALLAVFNHPREARRWLRRTTGLSLRPRRRPTPRPSPTARTSPTAPLAVGRSTAKTSPAPPPAAGRPTASSADERQAYIERRERDLAAPMAAMAAFCAERSIDLYFVTPYGPYFDLTEEELEEMSARHFLEEGARVHGGRLEALGAEVELITRVAHRVADEGNARVIDMLEASRRASLRTSPDFTDDGVHLSPAGNAALGRRIAERIVRDIEARHAGGN